MSTLSTQFQGNVIKDLIPKLTNALDVAQRESQATGKQATYQAVCRTRIFILSGFLFTAPHAGLSIQREPYTCQTDGSFSTWRGVID